jgi:hypothetical protein
VRPRVICKRFSKSLAEITLWPRAPPARPAAAKEVVKLIPTMMGKKVARFG